MNETAVLIVVFTTFFGSEINICSVLLGYVFESYAADFLFGLHYTKGNFNVRSSEQK